MPAYEYYCDKCRGDVTVTLPISEHDKAKVACPQCGSTALRPLVSSFFCRGSEQARESPLIQGSPAALARRGKKRGRALK